MTKTITPVEYAKQRGLSLDFVYKQLRVGKIPGTKIGKTWAIPQAALKPSAKRAAEVSTMLGQTATA
jgi:excisionase family DNA binding protein